MRAPVRLRPGDRLVAVKKSYTTGEKERGEWEKVTVRVVKQYTHHVLVEDRKGTRWCIQHADLFATGEAGMEGGTDNGRKQDGCNRYKP